MSYEGIPEGGMKQVEIALDRLEKFRELFAREIEDRMSVPGAVVAEEFKHVPERIQRGEKIPRLIGYGTSLEGALLLKGEALGFSPEEIETLKKLTFED